MCSAHLSKGASTNLAAALSSTEALLQLLLGARFADPVLLNWHARSLESFSKLLAMKPELVQAVMQKVCHVFMQALCFVHYDATSMCFVLLFCNLHVLVQAVWLCHCMLLVAVH